jgi:hypothetical protein
MTERIDAFRIDEARISCTCKKCVTEIVVDLSKEPKFGDKCPSCEGALNSMDSILKSLRNARAQAGRGNFDVKLVGPAAQP